MIVTTAFCLNFLLVSNSPMASLPTNAHNTSPARTAAILNIGIPAVVDEEAESKKQVDEDIFITGDPLLKKLKGKLRGAFEAFEKGDFELAEFQFGRLASRQFDKSQERRFVELIAPVILNLPLNRSASFSPDKWDALSETPVSATLSRSRSKDVVYSSARISAAASKLFFLKGVAQQQQGKTEKALKSYQQALRLHKNNVDARVEYALLLLRQNDLETSGKQLDKLAMVFDAKCRDNRCKYAPDSKKRYGQIKLAYANIVAQTKGM